MLVLAVVPAFLGESHFAFLGYAQNIRQTPIRRRLDYLRVLGASKESAKELRLFGLSGFLSGQYAILSNGIYDQNVRLARRRLWAGAALSLLSTAGYYGAYAYVIYRTVTGALTWGSLQFLAGAIAGTSSNIQNVFSTFSSIADQSLFLTDLVEFMQIGPKICSKPDAIPAPRPVRDGFAFEKVSFSYPGSRRRILDRLDFRIEAGERIAVIGENGQGKTTLVKLLTRLYDPTAGRILLDGVDLRDYSIEDLHSQIGVIFQDFMRYEMTARENISTGRIELPSDGRGVRGGAAELGRPGDRQVAEWVRPASRLAIRRRRGPLGRRVAKDRAGPRLLSRRPGGGARRTHRQPGRALRVRSVPALRGTDRGQNGRAHLAPVFHGADGRPDRGFGKRQRSPNRGATANCCRWAAATPPCLNCRHPGTDEIRIHFD